MKMRIWKNRLEISAPYLPIIAFFSKTELKLSTPLTVGLAQNNRL